MKTIKFMIMMAALTLAWGCSSSDDDATNGGDQEWNGSTFDVSAKPAWAIDWSSDVVKPDWQDPDPTKYECSMTMLIRLVDNLAPYSTDDDMMAIFMGGECRGVSYRNKLADGKVAFLLHVKGTSEEANQHMELRYYCGGLHHLTITEAISPFVPNNVLDNIYKIDFDITHGSTKYPLNTMLTVILPQKLPFTPNSDDMLAVFVDGECRGVGYQNADLYEGWRVSVMGRSADETAQIRYYSADKGGTYTILKTFNLTGNIQQENISF